MTKPAPTKPEGAKSAPASAPVAALTQGEPVYDNNKNGEWTCGRTWNDYRYHPLCSSRPATTVYAPPPKEEKKAEEKKGGDAKKPAEEEKKAEAFAQKQLTPEQTPTEL